MHETIRLARQSSVGRRTGALFNGEGVSRLTESWQRLLKRHVIQSVENTQHNLYDHLGLPQTAKCSFYTSVLNTVLVSFSCLYTTLHFLPYVLNICRKFEFLISQASVASCLG